MTPRCGHGFIVLYPLEGVVILLYLVAIGIITPASSSENPWTCSRSFASRLRPASMIALIFKCFSEGTKGGRFAFFSPTGLQTVFQMIEDHAVPCMSPAYVLRGDQIPVLHGTQTS